MDDEKGGKHLPVESEMSDESNNSDSSSASSMLYQLASRYEIVVHYSVSCCALFTDSSYSSDDGETFSNLENLRDVHIPSGFLWADFTEEEEEERGRGTQ